MSEPLNISTARVALVGDRSPSVRAHSRIPALLDALARRDQLVLDAYWIPTQDAESADALDGFDAIWLVPGSPYRSEAGAIAAARTARERGSRFWAPVVASSTRYWSSHATCAGSRVSITRRTGRRRTTC